MQWIILGLLIIIFFVWGISSIRYFFNRISLLLKLKKIKGSSPDTKLKYKNILSLFADMDTKTSQVLLYSKGTLYIIKLCGAFRKNTDIIALDANRWQMFTLAAFNLAHEKEPRTKASDITLDFKVNQEKQAIMAALANNPVNIKSVILFSPEPAGFYAKIHGNNEAVGFGAEWNGYLIVTPNVLTEVINNSEQAATKLSTDEWNRIIKAYKKIK